MREREKYLHEQDLKREKELRESFNGPRNANYGMIAGTNGGDPFTSLDGLAVPNAGPGAPGMGQAGGFQSFNMAGHN